MPERETHAVMSTAPSRAGELGRRRITRRGPRLAAARGRRLQIAVVVLVVLSSLGGYVLATSMIHRDRQAAAVRRASSDSDRAQTALERVDAYLVGLGTVLADERAPGETRFAFLAGTTSATLDLVDVLWLERHRAHLVAAYATTLPPGTRVDQFRGLGEIARHDGTIFGVTATALGDLAAERGFYLLESARFGRLRTAAGYLALFVPEAWLRLSIGDARQDVGITLDGQPLGRRLSEPAAAAAAFSALGHRWQIQVPLPAATPLQSALPWVVLSWPLVAAAFMGIIGRAVIRRRRAERHVERIFDLSPDLITIVRMDTGAFIRVNPAFEKMLGYPRDVLLSRHFLTFIHPDDREHTLRHEPALLRGEDVLQFENRYIRSDGSVCWLQWNVRPVLAEGILYCTARDITENRRAEAERQRIEEANRRLASIVEHTGDAVLAVNAEGHITEWNHGAERLFGYCAVDAIGRPFMMLLPVAQRPEEWELIQSVFRGDSLEDRECECVRRDTTAVDVAMTVSPMRDGTGAIIAASVIARDISERKRYQGELQYLADHDSLTGLFNRRRFCEELDRELARARRGGVRGAILAIDLDHFKYVNDSLGHSVGDALIAETGRLFARRVRSTDVVARIGGDEFALILPDISEAESCRVAADLLDAVRSELKVDFPGGSRPVTASIGIAAFCAEQNLSGEELLVEADIAMYDAKEAGRNRSAVYSATDDREERLQVRMKWGERIRRALDEDRLVLHAQRIVPLAASQETRHEVLVRMIDDHGELVMPSAFLSVAERMDLIDRIDRWVTRQAIRVLAREQVHGRDTRLNVNLSAISVGDEDLPEFIAQELECAGADGRGLCFEITETAAIINLDRARRFALRVADLGCQFALDDFGAGFASFYYLKHLPFDYLKIDGEFIKDLARNPTDQLVVRSIVEIAHGLGKATIAEFVTDERSLELLRTYGVDYAQGFYVAEPEPLIDIDMIAGGKSA